MKTEELIKIQEELERIVDETDLQQTLQLLSAVCFEKAYHIESNWQDSALAQSWEIAGKAIEKLSVNQRIMAVC